MTLGLKSINKCGNLVEVATSVYSQYVITVLRP